MLESSLSQFSKPGESRLSYNLLLDRKISRSQVNLNKKLEAQKSPMLMNLKNGLDEIESIEDTSESKVCEKMRSGLAEQEIQTI